MEGVTIGNNSDHRREEGFQTWVFRKTKKIGTFLENLRSEGKILTSEIEFSWREILEMHLDTSDTRGNTSEKYTHEILTEERTKYLIKVNKGKLRKLSKTLA